MHSSALAVHQRPWFAFVRVRQSRRLAAVGLGVVEEVCINHPIAIRLNEKPMERRKGEFSSYGE